ncbi:MAG: hypothetical protein ACYS30_12165 [Planctomycetota bacterium]|jgi:hypothetical protein
MCVKIPTPDDFKSGYESFRENEPRDAMYKVATFLVSHFWGHYTDMTNALGVLLLTWNQACYRYGSFSYDSLEKCLMSNWHTIERYRERDFSSLSKSDEKDILKIFNEFLEALQIAEGKSRGNKSPVAVAKALHLLAPRFLPLWDAAIAKAYNCNYSRDPAHIYLLFYGKMRTFANAIRECNDLPNDVTLLKLIDEYNYAKYTKKWV